MAEYNEKEFATRTNKRVLAMWTTMAIVLSAAYALDRESGRGFAVVADEIRNLSTGTKDSSESIMEALQLLEDTSDKMTESVTMILELIDATLEKIQTVNTSVGTITESAEGSKEITSAMPGKYEETVQNVANIEEIVGKLVEELETGETE